LAAAAESTAGNWSIGAAFDEKDALPNATAAIASTNIIRFMSGFSALDEPPTAANTAQFEQARKPPRGHP
jgi:hypothetical protein